MPLEKVVLKAASERIHVAILHFVVKCKVDRAGNDWDDSRESDRSSAFLRKSVREFLPWFQFSNLVGVVGFLLLIHYAVHQKGQNRCNKHDISSPKHHVEIFILRENLKISLKIQFTAVNEAPMHLKTLPRPSEISSKMFFTPSWRSETRFHWRTLRCLCYLLPKISPTSLSILIFSLF